MQFVAIDFETANHRPDSACQLALVSVRDGQIVEQRCWLMRPPRMYFSPRNIEIHGIRPEQVEDQPTIEQLWTQIASVIEGDVVVAHNARFDVGVLVASLAAFDLACPSFEFTCTRSLARQAWPGQPRYGLKPLGTWLGIDFKHHDALEDARCCAQVLLRAAERFEANSLVELEQRLRVSRGRYAMGKITSPRALGKRARDAFGGSATPGTDRWGFPKSRKLDRRGQLDCDSIVEASGSPLPLNGKRIVFLGSLRGLSSEETIEFARRLGAECQSELDSRTQYVIACGATDREQAESAIQDALFRRPEVDSASASLAVPIRVLSERQFLALLPGGKAAVRW